MLSLYDPGTYFCKEAFICFRESLEQVFGHNGVQNCVTQVFKPLIMDRFGTGHVNRGRFWQESQPVKRKIAGGKAQHFAQLKIEPAFFQIFKP
jgi:hypothetical protein